MRLPLSLEASLRSSNVLVHVDLEAVSLAERSEEFSSTNNVPVWMATVHSFVRLDEFAPSDWTKEWFM